MNKNPKRERYEYVRLGAFMEILCLFRCDAGGGYRVTAPELPELLAFGDTLDEARESVRDELLVCLPGSEALRDRLSDAGLTGDAEAASDKISH